MNKEDIKDIFGKASVNPDIYDVDDMVNQLYELFEKESKKQFDFHWQVETNLTKEKADLKAQHLKEIEELIEWVEQVKYVGTNLDNDALIKKLHQLKERQ